MKKYVLVILLILLLGTTTVVSASNFKSGVSIGPNLSWSDEGDDRSSRFGFTGGFYQETEFRSGHDAMDLSLRTGLYLTTKGYRTELIGGSTYKFDSSYLEMPLLIKTSFPSNSDTTPYFLFGPSIGFIVGAEEKVENGTNDKYEDMNTFAYGLVMGMGVMMEQKASVEIRFDRGLTEAEKNADWKNRSLSLVTSYYFM